MTFIFVFKPSLDFSRFPASSSPEMYLVCTDEQLI